MKLSTRCQILLLLVVVLGIYYPAIFGDYNSVDDRMMVNDLLNRQPGNLLSLFLPNQEFYYRPVLILTYMLDGHLWGFLPLFMHLENILLHVANTLLVFVLARHFVASSNDRNSPLPLISSLLFGLHPIVTESACWISGRTDLLGAFFVLLSFLCLALGIKKENVWFGVPAAVFLLLGIMSKEVMLFFLPLAVFLVLRWPDERTSTQLRKRWALTGVYSLPFIIAAGFYGFVRFASFGVGDQGVLHILNNYAYTPFHTLRVCFKVLGFYVKKLFVPLPLNFAIVQVNDQYVWLGIVVLVFILYTLFRPRLSTDLLSVSFLLILPAVIIALSRVAWTPLAERYLYLPTAFWSVGVVVLLNEGCKRFNLHGILIPALALLLLPMGWVSSSRALVWQDNLLLYGETIRKSPEFLPLYNEYAVALAEEGRLSESEEYLEKARQMDSRAGVSAIHTNQASLLASDGRVDEALGILDGLLQGKEGTLSVNLLRQVAKAGEQVKLKVVSPEQREAVNQLLADIYERLYLATKDPFVRYQQGQFAMFNGKRALAGEYFEQAYKDAPETAHYKQTAKILAAKMKTER